MPIAVSLPTFTIVSLFIKKKFLISMDLVSDISIFVLSITPAIFREARICSNYTSIFASKNKLKLSTDSGSLH